jgi:clan AA aspartic protease (TIGR02281 family)
MKCPNCSIPVKSFYSYCPSCGAHLGEKRGGFLHTLLILIGIGVVAGGAWNLFQNDSQKLPTVENNHPQPRDIPPTPRILSASSESKSQPIRLAVGLVVIEDITGNQIAQMPAALSSGGWIAIPAKLVLGGYSWFFQFKGGEPSEFTGGIIGDDDEAGIWQIRVIDPIPGPQIASGNMEQAFEWHSILSDKTVDTSHPAVISDQQNCIHIDFPAANIEPGVFIQNGHIVGWSFGELIPGGYIWKGVDGADLVLEMSVNDFYRATFEGGREEQFILAYAHQKTNPLKGLEYFANGFRADAKLSEKDAPAYLKGLNVIPGIRQLTSELSQAGYGGEVSEIFDSTVLSRAGDVELMSEVIRIVSDTRGNEAAVHMVEGVIRRPGNFDKAEASQIRVVLKDNYKKWLTDLVDSREYAKGFDVYTRAADMINDPDIHLLGVKFALAFNDWETAENILRSHRFPVDAMDQVKLLEGEIAQLKYKESDKYQDKDKIVIHFAPGSSHIPVSAVLNKTVNLNFIVDTGASMVTIPSAAAKALGIDVDAAPVRQLMTASQIITAPEVTLESIQIGEWVERHVNAFILDMPDQYGVGLLGLNYLNRFRMEVNSKAGVLTLTPR